MFWDICLSRNDIVFDKSSMKTCMHVLHRGTPWLRFWAQLLRHEEGRDLISKACRDP